MDSKDSMYNRSKDWKKFSDQLAARAKELRDADLRAEAIAVQATAIAAHEVANDLIMKVMK